ncbi:MAG: metallophosphoesterase [Williamsia sp.]|nr:metallophosphoesterase [Williamsia sp.]
MRKLLQKILAKPVTRLAERVSSSPRQQDVYASLDALLKCIREEAKEKGVTIPFDINTGKFVIFSDQHKGGGDLADDFVKAESNYITALQFYRQQGFCFINLGDCEELWENTPKVVMERNRSSLAEEARFLQTGMYFRVFGNHDLEWKYAIQQLQFLQPVFGNTLKVYEGILLQCVYNAKTYSIFLTHGHQGDKRSDGNAFSKWVVAAIWTPIQRFLEISTNSVSDSYGLVDKHNIIMHDWCVTQPDMVFISGHTHKPVFASLDHIDRLNKQLKKAEAANNVEEIESIKAELKKREAEYAGKTDTRVQPYPCYFNTGCCCFEDGDITGLEIEDGFIRLIKWENKDKISKRRVLEESPLFYLFDKLEEMKRETAPASPV